MKNYTLKRMIIDGLMVALVFLATAFTSIPNGLGGYFNIGDTVIIVTAILLGSRSGFIAGAIGSCIADLYLGYPLFAPITFIVKGSEGLVVGLLSRKASINPKIKIFAASIGAIIMVVGYFFAESFILGIVDEYWGITIAVQELIPNLIQGAISVVLGLTIAIMLQKTRIVKALDLAD